MQVRQATADVADPADRDALAHALDTAVGSLSQARPPGTVLKHHEELVAGHVLYHLVQVGDVWVVELLEDGHFATDVTERVCPTALAPQTLPIDVFGLVDHLDSVLPLVDHIDTEHHAAERARAEGLHQHGWLTYLLPMGSVRNWRMSRLSAPEASRSRRSRVDLTSLVTVTFSAT